MLVELEPVKIITYFLQRLATFTQYLSRISYDVVAVRTPMTNRGCRPRCKI